MLSQVPKGEVPGAPIFSGCSHFSRHMGHPLTRRQTNQEILNEALQLYLEREGM
jgi:hypothetical protein